MTSFWNLPCSFQSQLQSATAIDIFWQHIWPATRLVISRLSTWPNLKDIFSRGCQCLFVVCECTFLLSFATVKRHWDHILWISSSPVFDGKQPRDTLVRACSPASQPPHTPPFQLLMSPHPALNLADVLCTLFVDPFFIRICPRFLQQTTVLPRPLAWTLLGIVNLVFPNALASSLSHMLWSCLFVPNGLASSLS